MSDATVEYAPPSAREGQIRSPFTAILETLCDSCIGAIAAGLVDEEGECVDLAFLPTREIPAYSIKLCGAHWQIVMRDAMSSPKLANVSGPLRQMWVHAAEYSYVLAHLHSGYVLVLICRPDALSAVSRRALRQVEVELSKEAGWPHRDSEEPYWRRAHVLLDHQGNPRALRYVSGFVAHGTRGWDATISVVAGLSDLDDFERGFEVRTDAGDRLRLVREPSGYWYAGIDLPTDLE